MRSILGKVAELLAPDRVLIAAAITFMLVRKGPGEEGLGWGAGLAGAARVPAGAARAMPRLPREPARPRNALRQAAAACELSIPHYVTAAVFSAAKERSEAAFRGNLAALAAATAGYAGFAAVRGWLFSLVNTNLLQRLRRASGAVARMRGTLAALRAAAAGRRCATGAPGRGPTRVCLPTARKRRSQLFGRLIRQPVAFFDSTETAQLTSRLAADCRCAAGGCGGCRRALCCRLWAEPGAQAAQAQGSTLPSPLTRWLLTPRVRSVISRLFSTSINVAIRNALQVVRRLPGYAVRLPPPPPLAWWCLAVLLPLCGRCRCCSCWRAAKRAPAPPTQLPAAALPQVGGAAYLWRLSPQMAAATAGVGAALVLVAGTYGAFTRRAQRVYQVWGLCGAGLGSASGRWLAVAAQAAHPWVHRVGASAGSAASQAAAGPAS